MNTTYNKTTRRPQRTAFTLALILLLLTAAIFAALPASAASYDYTTDLYSVEVKVGEDNTYEISEKIQVDFDTQKHGIYRYIPHGNYKDMGYMSIRNINVPGWEYETYDENGNTVVKIGSADTTVTGKQEYIINYELRVYEDRDASRDFLYLDVLPTDWETPIGMAQVSVKMPKAVDEGKIEIYSSRYGSNDSGNVQWFYDDSSNEILISGVAMERGVGITVFCELPEGYWQGEATYTWAKVLAIVLLCVLCAATVLLWFFFGRDKKIVPTVEFYPPEGMNPAEVGYIIDRTVNKRDIVSLIMYFADRGYMSIEQLDKKEFVLTKLKEIDPGEKSFAKTLFKGLFSGRDSVNLDDLDEDFGDRYVTAYQQLYDHFTKKNNRQASVTSQVLQAFGVVFLMLAETASAIAGAWYSGKIPVTVACVLAAVISLIILMLLIYRERKRFVLKTAGKFIGGTILWIFKALCTAIYAVLAAWMFDSIVLAPVIGALIFAAEICTVFMVQRTKKSIEQLGKILGLKNFIEVAEIDKLNMLVEENPNYFYNILPYAYVMGLTDKWAKNFEKISVVQPSWYHSRGGGFDIFDVWMFSRMMNNCSHSFENNIHIPTGGDSGSGGGGFSAGGGGFSGGGFGGGGGGSW